VDFVHEDKRATATMQARFSRKERRVLRFSGVPNLADYISKLQGAGVNLLPDDALESYLRRVAGLPRRTAPSSPPPPIGLPSLMRQARAARHSFGPDQ
jgi:hypothetical protein